jgi:hypothetical protein
MSTDRARNDAVHVLQKARIKSVDRVSSNKETL